MANDTLWGATLKDSQYFFQMQEAEKNQVVPCSGPAQMEEVKQYIDWVCENYEPHCDSQRLTRRMWPEERETAERGCAHLNLKPTGATQGVLFLKCLDCGIH